MSRHALPARTTLPLPGRAAAARTLLALLLAATPALAHDFWLEPSTWRPAPGQRFAVRARVGSSFLGDPVPRDESLLVRFVVAGRDGEAPVPGVPGADPAGIAQAPPAGAAIVAYESRGSLAELTPEKTALYVAQEGLQSQLAPATLRDLQTRVVRDRFARAVKALLVVRGGPGAGFDRVVGLPLELVPGVDPATLGDGGTLPLRLLWAGRPLGGVQVAALSRLDPAHPLLARTDAAGAVTFHLPRGGDWLVKAVRVTTAAPGSGADLESVWTSLTFRAGSE